MDVYLDSCGGDNHLRSSAGSTNDSVNLSSKFLYLSNSVVNCDMFQDLLVNLFAR